MRRVIRVTNSFNDQSEIAPDVRTLINILEYDYGTGNRGYYQLLRSSSVFRGVNYLEIKCDKGTVYLNAVHIYAFIHPNYVDQLTDIIETAYNNQ